MKKLLILTLFIAAITGAAWFVLRDGGVLEQVTEERVRTALLDSGAPAPLADCMAPQLVDRLSLTQLKKLERLGPAEGESRVPMSPGEAIARMQRVDDDEAVAALVGTGGKCALRIGLDSLL